MKIVSCPQNEQKYTRKCANNSPEKAFQKKICECHKRTWYYLVIQAIGIRPWSNRVQTESPGKLGQYSIIRLSGLIIRVTNSVGLIAQGFGKCQRFAGWSIQIEFYAHWVCIKNIPKIFRVGFLCSVNTNKFKAGW